MRLIAFLTKDGVADWDEWHGAHMQAEAGDCPYLGKCSIYKRTIANLKRI